MALIEQRVADRPLSLRGVALRITKRLSVWRTRRALARLDAHLLKDVGISAAQARHEADLTVWDVPETWNRR
ncbi:MAG: DUF1127 domain-containing protein [Roseobacter sp.]